MMSAFSVASDGWGPVKEGPSKGSRPLIRANKTTPRDHTSRGGPRQEKSKISDSSMSCYREVVQRSSPERYCFDRM